MRALAVTSNTNETSSERAGGNYSHKQERGPVKVSALPGSSPFSWALQRKSVCACDGGCPLCRGIQPKLTIGQPDDKYEREADRVADRVMRMPEPKGSLVNGHSSLVQRQAGCTGPACTEEEEPVQTKSIGDQITPLDYVQRQEETVPAEKEEEEEPAQLKPLNNKSPPVTANLQNQIQSLRGGGQPLGETIRAFFESRFGRDFSQVRVHTDEIAAAASKSVNARAFTLGKDVVFGTGQYQPASTEGRRLLAHELTHVVQQQPLRKHSLKSIPQTPGNLADSSNTNQQLQRQSIPEMGEINDPLSGEETTNQKIPGSDSTEIQNDPPCPGGGTGLGYVKPTPGCPESAEDIGFIGEHFHFCRDSDIFLLPETPKSLAIFARKQPPDSRFIVHGYASIEGSRNYNMNLACHRANRVTRELIKAGVSPEKIETASKGPTTEFPGGLEFNRVVVVLAEARRFGYQRDDPRCPKAPTGLGNVEPDPDCPKGIEDIGSIPTGPHVTRFYFCLDSDIYVESKTPTSVAEFARNQPALSYFTVHGYASIEGGKDYNFDLACHRAKRVARELINAGVPSEQIEIASKGGTDEFPGGREFNRVVVVRSRPPFVAALPGRLPANTPEEKHKIVRLAREQINQGGYRLGADAYISFWTCGRVPSVRHAVNTTRFLVEGDPGVPELKKGGKSTIYLGRVEGFGLNTSAISDDVFETEKQLECVMHAITHMSFHHKVRDEEFKGGHEMGSERFEAAEYLVHLAGYRCGSAEPLEDRADPRADKPAPACLQAPLPTYHGPPTPGEKAATVPRFVVEESSFTTASGSTVLNIDALRNRAYMSTSEVPFVGSATVRLYGNPREFLNYDVGFILTITEDRTDIKYKDGEEVKKVLPVPIRDIDTTPGAAISGTRPVEPWFADDAFETPQQGVARPFMFKIMVEEMAFHYEDMAGGDKQQLGSALNEAKRRTRFQLWLVSRRRGAPLDRFSTHFLDGTAIIFQQDLELSGNKVNGQFTSKVSIAETNKDLVRLRDPVPEDLGPRETTTTNVLPKKPPQGPCDAAFNAVKFGLKNQRARGITNAATLKRDKSIFNIEVVKLEGTKPVDYKPEIAIHPQNPQVEIDKFEVGLIQNILSNEETFKYSTGEVVHGILRVPPPLKDGSRDYYDEIFVSNGKGPPEELARFSASKKQVKLEQGDTPGTGAFLDASNHPFCPGKKQGTLTEIVMRDKFRTWVGVRFDRKSDCVRALHHIDWETNWLAEVNPDKEKSTSLDVTNPDGDGSPTFVSGRPLVSEVHQDDACD